MILRINPMFTVFRASRIPLPPTFSPKPLFSRKRHAYRFISSQLYFDNHARCKVRSLCIGSCSRLLSRHSNMFWYLRPYNRRFRPIGSSPFILITCPAKQKSFILCIKCIALYLLLHRPVSHSGAIIRLREDLSFNAARRNLARLVNTQESEKYIRVSCINPASSVGWQS